MKILSPTNTFDELQLLRAKMEIKNPKIEQIRNPISWHENYWANVMSLLTMGAYLFVWGIVFAVVIAGGLMIVGAVLFWALAIIMVIFYPVFLFFEWVGSLFKNKTSVS